MLGELELRALKILAGAALVAATVHAGRASAAPSEAAVLARIEQYCANPAPEAIAALVAKNGHGENDPAGLAQLNRPPPEGARHVASRAWTMHESDTWWLRVGVIDFPDGPMTQCTVRVADLREAEMERLLRAAPQWTFTQETIAGDNDNTWVRDYRSKTTGRMLLYTTTMIGPPSVRRFHTFSVMGGPRIAKGIRR